MDLIDIFILPDKTFPPNGWWKQEIVIPLAALQSRDLIKLSICLYLWGISLFSIPASDSAFCQLQYLNLLILSIPMGLESCVNSDTAPMI